MQSCRINSRQKYYSYAVFKPSKFVQVKRKAKPFGPKQEKSRLCIDTIAGGFGSSHNSNSGTTAVVEEREELDFQFDEELDVPTGRHNTFTDWLVICFVF